MCDVIRVCPICGHSYADVPALSRRDNKTLICPDCGIREALEEFGVSDSLAQDHVISLAKQYERRGKR